MTTLAVDVSNYTDPLTPAALACMRAGGVGLVIVQAVDPPKPYPPGVTRQQLEALQSAGIPTDAYVYLWWDEPLTKFSERLHLLDGFTIRRIWIDVEDTTSGKSVEEKTAILREAVRLVMEYNP